METIVLASPIFNSDMSVFSYRFSSKNYEDLLSFSPSKNENRDLINTKMLSLIEEIGLDAISSGMPILIPISIVTLMTDFKFSIAPEKVIFNVDSDIASDNTYIEVITKLKQKGYKFALNLDQNLTQSGKAAPFMDYVIVNKNTANKKQAIELMESLKENGVKVVFIASGVNGYHMFNLSKITGYKLFEGRFYHIPSNLETSPSTPLKAISIELINVVNRKEFELEEVSNIIIRDPMISISLLRYINSQKFGQKINSISHAVALLGQKEVIRWVNVSGTTALANEKPSEISRLALIRAKFAENLAPVFGLEDDSYSIFLLGLFSVLDVILDQDIKSALESLNISEEIYDALVLEEGPYKSLYKFLIAYEGANWAELARFSVLESISLPKASEAYVNTIKWYKETLDLLED